MEIVIDTTDRNNAEVYDLPTPDGSFMPIMMGDELVEMSTPEYLFYRKAVLLPTPQALAACLDLLVPYDNHTTSRSIPEGVYIYRGEPHTTIDKMNRYVSGFDSDEHREIIERINYVMKFCAMNLEVFEEEILNDFDERFFD